MKRLKILQYLCGLICLIASVQTANADCINYANKTWYVAPGTYTFYDSSVRGTSNSGDCPFSGKCDTQKLILSLHECGRADWRLPTIKELESLLQCPTGRSTDWVHGNPCNNYLKAAKGQLIQPAFSKSILTSVGSFWSSESYSALPDYAWYVDYLIGATNRSFKSDKRGIIAVSDSISCMLPTYSNGKLTIPQFAPGEQVYSAILHLNFSNSTFEVLEAK